MIGELSKSEVEFMMRRMPIIGRDHGDSPEAKFDSLAHEFRVDCELTTLVQSITPGELLECLTEMQGADLIAFQSTFARLRHTGVDEDAAALGRLVDRMFEKYFRSRIEAAIEREGE